MGIKKLLLIILAFFTLSCAQTQIDRTTDPTPPQPTWDEIASSRGYEYSEADYEKLIRHLILLGNEEERPVYIWHTHHRNEYGNLPDGSDDKSKYFMFQITKKMNDPEAGVELHAIKILYETNDVTRDKHTKERWNWVLYDDNIDGLPDRYVSSTWRVKNKKIDIEYRDVIRWENIRDDDLRSYLNGFWNSVVMMLMHSPMEHK